MSSFRLSVLLVVNGMLWSAGVEIPADGAASDIENAQLESMQTSHEPKKTVDETRP
jgi:hypothetical protein